MEQTPSLANPPLQTTPPVTSSSAPLHGILTGNSLIYVMPTSTTIFTSTIRQRRNDHEHFISVSISHPLCHQVSDASTIINIGSYTLVVVSDLIIFTVFDLIQLVLFDWIQLTISDWILLSFPQFDSNQV